jgi:cystathionine beta-synthase
MIEQAEREGKLAPGGTIVEPTSGNTGVGLAIAAALKGYRCVFVMPDKIAEEKRALLRAYGAEVVICPTAVPPESPESYYSVSNRLAEEIPGAFKPDQYSNQANPQAHYETTGPELWEQTGGKIDALVLSIGTGGTVTGTARYLKEQRPGLLVVGADPEGSIFSQPDNVHPYLVEGIGEDFWPTTFDPSLVDEFITVSDRDSFRTARRLAREEGILVGGSGGTAVWAMLQVAQRFGPDATVVTIVPDSGRGYLSKVYDDNWLLEHGFLERAPAATIQAVLSSKQDEEHAVPELVTVGTHQKVGEAIDLMQRYGISQIPVVRNGDEPTSLADVVGSIRESGLLDRVFRDQNALSEDIAAAMEPPLPAVEIGASVDTVFADLSAGNPAVVVASGGRPVGVRTRADRARPDGAAPQPRHARRLRPRPLPRLLRGARLEVGRRARGRRRLFPGGLHDRRALGARPTRGGQRRRGSRRVGRHHARLQLPLAGGSGCRDRGGTGRRSGDPAGGCDDVLGRLLGRLPRPRRPPVGGRAQPALDDRARRLGLARLSEEPVRNAMPWVPRSR